MSPLGYNKNRFSMTTLVSGRPKARHGGPKIDDMDWAPVEFPVQNGDRHINIMFHHRMRTYTRGEHRGLWAQRGHLTQLGS